MPVPIQDYQSRSAASELTKAGIAGLWFATGTEAGFNYLLGPVIKGIGKTAKAAATNTYKLTTGPLGKWGARSVARGISMYAPALGKLAVGGAKTAWDTGSWLFKHPVAVAGLAAGGGLALSAFDPNERMSNEVSASPSIVEMMGGNSMYGVKQMMQTMNASGDIVLGMNSRR